jgi:vitamin B12 transporter
MKPVVPQTTGSLYYTDAKNLIEGFNPPENIGAARIRGVELGFEISEQSWRLGAELTLQDAIDKSDGSDLPKRPGRSAVLAASRSFGPWEVNGQWKFVDKTGGGEFSTVPSYHVIGTNLRYQLAPAWQLAVSIDNLLDREYETTPNFPAPERIAMLTLEWQPE